MATGITIGITIVIAKRGTTMSVTAANMIAMIAAVIDDQSMIAAVIDGR
jgi:hypothetical protein